MFEVHQNQNHQLNTIKNIIDSNHNHKHCIYTYTFLNNMFQGRHVPRARFSTTINPLTGNNVHLRLSEFQFHMNIYLLKDFHYLHQNAS